MAFSALGDMLTTLENLGIMDVILPFILVFTLVFATLQKTKILGEKKNFNVIIALAMGLAVVIPHATNSYPQGADVVDIINASLPQVALVMIVMLAMMILIGLWGVSPAWKGPVTGFIMLAAFGIVIWIFAGAANFINVPEFLNDPELQAVIIILAIFGLIIKVITGSDEKTKGETFFESIGKFFEKGKD